MRKLSNFMLVAITLSAIVNLRGLSLMASGGYMTLGLSLLAVLCFLIPSTYVCAELSMHLNKRGGVYEWVQHAFGPRWGFIAIWMEWVNNIFGFPATLATIVGMFYLLLGHRMPSPFIFTLTMLAVLWLALWYNHWPIAFSSWLNILGSVGIIFIACLIIGLGGIWLLTSHVQLSNLIPRDMKHWSLQLPIFVSFIGAYSGMQITGFHTPDVENPRRQYKIALPLVAVLIVTMMLGSSTIMALLIPPSQLNVIAGVEQMMQLFFQHFNWPHFGNVIGTIILLATLASFSAWLIGPARGMQVALARANVNHFVARLNQFGMPTGLLMVQGVITSLLILLFVVMPSVKTAFWLLIAMTSQFTAAMYILIFAAGFKLIARTWLGKFLCSLGMLSCALGFIVGVFAPSELKILTYHTYTLSILVGDVLIIALGLWLTKCVF